MNSRELSRIGLSGLFLALAISTTVAQDSRKKIFTFDAPGAGTTLGQGTFPSQIRADGTIVGLYFDAGAVVHGFVRSSKGEILPVNDPNAGGAPGEGTNIVGINGAGFMVGSYADSNGVNHGLVVRWSQNALGRFVEYDAPGAGTGPGQGTTGVAINSEGTISGDYVDANYVDHGMVRMPSGKITSYDVPGGPNPLPVTLGIDQAGSIVGDYLDQNTGLANGYLRSADGTVAIISVMSSPVTFASSISKDGVISGYYTMNGVNHAFLREPNGGLTIFDAPAAGTGSNQGTVAYASSPDARITTGFYTDVNGVNHGFARDQQNNFTTLDAPGAGTGAGQGTFGLTVNPQGAIAGFYIDAYGAAHGFVWAE